MVHMKIRKQFELMKSCLSAILIYRCIRSFIIQKLCLIAPLWTYGPSLAQRSNCHLQSKLFFKAHFHSLSSVRNSGSTFWQAVPESSFLLLEPVAPVFQYSLTRILKAAKVSIKLASAFTYPDCSITAGDPWMEVKNTHTTCSIH